MEDKEISINEICSFLDKIGIDYNYCGEKENIIRGFASITNYKENCITWIKSEKNIPDIHSYPHVSLAIVSNKRNDIQNQIICNNPKKVFFDIIDNFWGDKNFEDHIGHGTVIGENVKLGKNVCIGCNCVINGNIQIGDNCIIDHGVIITNKVEIGEKTVIQSGSIIGYDGFAYSEDENGLKKMIKHYGGVTIGKNVFIGPNCLIDRGTIDDTVIEDNCKIDGLCHISHNSCLGQGTVLISGTRIFGSVKTGKNSYISSAIVKNQVKIGENTMVGMGSVITKDIDDDLIIFDKPEKIIKKNEGK